jgi:hypothetical protein
MQDPDLRPSRRAGLLGSRTVMDAPSSSFYSARLPWPVVRGADVVVFTALVTVLLTP